mgnify:CR=1 FL=1
MGTNGLNGRDYPGRLQWVATPLGEHRWTGGPLICTQTEGGWMLELAVHNERGRLSRPLAGPFEALGEAKEEAARLMLVATRRKMERVGGPLRAAA